MHNTWVFALPVNREIFIWDESSEEYVAKYISEDWALDLVNNTNQAIHAWEQDAPEGMSTFYPPILREHTLEGWRGGDILQARLAGDGDARGVYINVNWGDGVWKNITNQETQHVSIGTAANYVDSHGRMFKNIIKELSITSDPRLKDIGTIQDTLELILSEGKTNKALNEQEEVMTLEEMIETVAALTKRIEDAEAMLAELKADKELEKEDEPDPELSDKPDEEEEKKEEELVAKLSDKIADRLMSKMGKNIRLSDIPSKPAPAKKQLTGLEMLAKVVKG